MKNICANLWLLIVILLLAISPAVTLYASDLDQNTIERNAVIVGMEADARFEVSKIGFFWGILGASGWKDRNAFLAFYHYNGNDGLDKRIGVFTNTFHVAIPLDHLMSIQAQDDKAEVHYYWRGKDMTLSGKLFPGIFKCSSKIGNIEVKTSQIKTISFVDRPDTKNYGAYLRDSQENAELDSYLLLGNSNKVSIGALMVAYDQGTYTSHSDKLIIKKGGIKVELDLDSLIKVEFDEDKIGITATASNGTTLSGHLYKQYESDEFIRPYIQGFTGVNEISEFFIPIDRVKGIEFQRSTNEAPQISVEYARGQV